MYLSRIGELLWDIMSSSLIFCPAQDCRGNWHSIDIGLDPNWQCVCWIGLDDVDGGFCFVCQIRPLYDFFP